VGYCGDSGGGFGGPVCSQRETEEKELTLNFQE
jgi:hypothetical protein